MALDAITGLMARYAIVPRATLLIRRKLIYADGAIVYLRAWSVPAPVPPSTHGFKYSLVYIVNGGRVIGFDNERGKGDHRHVKGTESPYAFISLERLLADFTAEVEKMRNEPSESQQAN